MISYLKKIRVGALLIATIAALISKKVIRAELVLEQLHWLSDAGVLAAMAALAATPTFQMRPNRLATKLLFATMLLAFCAVVAIRASLTEEIQIGGTVRRYLVGTNLTEVGRTMEQNCIQGEGTRNLTKLSRYELIKCAGPTSISAVYGSSYLAVAIVYAIAYLWFLGIFVLLVGGFLGPDTSADVVTPPLT